ncbi:MAG: helix-turn-helix domain-containing protein [Dehalococcoidia bacterium]
MQLGILLREARERLEISSKDVAEKLEWHRSKVTKLEKGATKISAPELDRLIEIYQIEGEQADRVRELGREARKRGVMGRVPDWAQTYVELEQAAEEIKLYEGELVPALLQTEDYARALLATSLITPPEDAEQRAKERVRRQERLTNGSPPRLWAVVGEAALHRLVGGPAVLRGQLRWFRELAAMPHVTVQILPFSAGEHAALGTQIRILEFADPRVTFVYLEWLTDAEYYDRPPHTDVYTLAFSKVLVAAADERASKRMLDRRIKELGPD